jgi:hypothetical protein
MRKLHRRRRPIFASGVIVDGWQIKKGLATLGHSAYDRALRLNRRLNALLQRLGWSPWPIRSSTKPEGRVPTASCAATSTTPSFARTDGFVYANSGDWVESCTALVEHFEGAPRDPPLGRHEGRSRKPAAA